VKNAVHVVLLPRREAHKGLRGREKLAAQSALARDALALSARACGAQLEGLLKDGEDAPLPSNGWHWSLSHASGFAAGAVCRAPIGIDVEEIAPRRADVVARACSREELEVLGGFSWKAFARAWTAKEAVLKKAGVGLLELGRCRIVAAADERTLVLRHRDRNHVVAQSVQAGHVAAVTHDGRDGEVAWAWSTIVEREDLVPAPRLGERA
jgi:4'-phosphopantetheinyl transferase